MTTVLLVVRQPVDQQIEFRTFEEVPYYVSAKNHYQSTI